MSWRCGVLAAALSLSASAAAQAPALAPDDAKAIQTLVTGYAQALAYTNRTVGGYLREHADRDMVMILIGDHQPPAAVSGEGVSWDVPVHVIASRRQVLDRLIQQGFREGLAPPQATLTSIHQLLPILLGAFGDS